MQQFLTNPAALEMHRSVFVRKEGKTGTGEQIHLWLPEVSTDSPDFPVGSAHLPHPHLERPVPDLIEHCILYGFPSLWPLFLQFQPSRTRFPEIQLRSHCQDGSVGFYAESFLKNARLECNSFSNDWECHWHGQGGNLAAEEQLDFTKV